MIETMNRTTPAAAPDATVGAITDSRISHQFLHWGDACTYVRRSPGARERAALAAAWHRGGLGAVLTAARFSGDGGCGAWGLAMTATYGPTGLHSSWVSATTGRPTEEALLRFPSVRRAMNEALKTLCARLGV